MWFAVFQGRPIPSPSLLLRNHFGSILGGVEHQLGGVEHRLTAPCFAMAYNLTSGDLVQRRLVLGNRSLLAPQVAPHATGTSLPQVAPQATGTSPPQVDHHIAPQSDRHIVHCPKPTAMSTAHFSQLLSYINCYGVGIAQEAWHSKFGIISYEYPWGADFWNGFTSLLATDYLPRSKMSHLRNRCLLASILHSPHELQQVGSRGTEEWTQSSQQQQISVVRIGL